MNKIERRDVIKAIGIAALATGGGIGITFLAKQANGHPLLRPPGALGEEDFLASCIKCGQCIQVCPFESLKLLDLSAGINTATPYIDPWERGCYLCDLFPCILCCPSGALDDKVQKIEQVHMGIATLNAPERCLNHKGVPLKTEQIQRIINHGNRTELEKELNEKLGKEVGKVCEICLLVCKVEKRDKAIKLVDGQPQIGPACVGCGACQEVCPEKIIEILPAGTYEQVYSQKR